ncbi:gamma-interferon-inducible lysosomal thiol reductase-like [Penaeus indicus]|uniref:gamma-interferon-inducible lysosomal thiol reductase-like n=1 Tax=Penaeus indicus TaxID=29960 RepID=UPI00300D9E3A
MKAKKYLGIVIRYVSGEASVLFTGFIQLGIPTTETDNTSRDIKFSNYDREPSTLVANVTLRIRTWRGVVGVAWSKRECPHHTRGRGFDDLSPSLAPEEPLRGRKEDGTFAAKRSDVTARTTQEKNGKITFDCQHGPRECEGNIVHACVTNLIKDEAKQIAIVHCMIDRNEQPMVVGKKCVEKHGEKWGSISSCVTSDKGASILKHMGEMTHRLKPEVTFIPTITIDGSQEDQKHILLDFHKVLCKRYKGPRHPSC